MGAIMYLLALPMEALLGWSISSIIIFTGLSVIIYSMLGGIEAVIWTDAIQGIVLIGGALACLGVLFFGIPVQRRQVFGVVIGFIGCVLLVLSENGGNTSENYYYAILIVIASLFYGINVNFIKKYLSDLKPLTISTGNFLIMLFPALLVLYFSDFFAIATDEKVVTSLGFIAVLGIVGTGFSNILFFRLIQLSSPVFASSVTYIIPVVAFILGFFVMDETLSLLQGFGALVVLVGVYFSSRK